MNKSFRQVACAFLILTGTSELCAGGSLTDYGATPAVARPESDLPAANQKLDYHTDLYTGRFDYQIPIEVSPARQGSQPSVALQYNSSDGNGWCGVGWDVSIPYIQRDTRKGVPASGLAYNDANGFVFSVNGKSGRLVVDSDGTYRPEIDTDFLKFTYISATSYWILKDKDGRVYNFGDSASSKTTNFYGTFKWFITKVQDPNATYTSYTYQSVGDGQIYPQWITYNASSSASGAIVANCSIIFNLQTGTRPDVPCSSISGASIPTSRLLDTIAVYNNGNAVRRYNLGYIVSPSTGRSLLQTVTQVGTNLSTALPPYTFTYQGQAHSFKAPTAWPFSAMPDPQSQGGTEPGTQNIAVTDIDGDGLPDWVVRQTFSPYSSFNVQLNSGGTAFSSTVKTWATLKNEANDLTADWNTINRLQPQIIGAASVLSELIDLNGDRLPDRVLRQYSTNPDGSYDHFELYPNTGTGFSPSLTSVSGVSSQNATYAPTVMNTTTATSQDGSINMAVLTDMNGDGLPDRVMLGKNDGYFDVQINTGTSFGTISSWPVVKVNPNYPWDCAPRYRDPSFGTVYSELMDMNGDGLPDRVSLGGTPSTTISGVQLNNGVKGFASTASWGLGSTENFESINVQNGCFTIQLLDVNGDGLPDLVTSAGNGTYSVRFNTGSGFVSAASAVTWTGVDLQGDGTSGWGDLQAWDNYGSKVMFADMNGDGLVDRVKKDPGGNAKLQVQLNSGPFPDLLTNVNNGIGGNVGIAYVPSTRWNNTDGTRPRLPFPVYTVSSMTVDDGIRNTGATAAKWTYQYTNGLYDTTYREFRGFAVAQETDPLGRMTVTWFYQGGGLDRSASGELSDSRFKAGMPYDVLLYGADGKLYKETRNQVVQTRLDVNGVYFPFVTNVFAINWEIPATPKYRLTQYSFKLTADDLANSTGNLRTNVDWGEVTNLNVQTYAYSDVADASGPVYTSYIYASLANPDILNRVKTATVSADAACNVILRETTNLYDGATGNLLEEHQLVCPGTWAVTTHSYDGYGNRITTTDPVGIVTHLDYDTATRTYPWRKYTGTLAANLIEYTLYDQRTGLASIHTNLQGMVTANTYDVLLRLIQTSISTTVNGPANLWRVKYAYALGGMAGNSSQNTVNIQKNDPAHPSPGYIQSWTFMDGLGRPIQAQNQAETGNYRVVDYFYDQRGDLMVQTYPLFKTASVFVVPTGTETCVYTVSDTLGRPYQFYQCATATFNANGTLNGNPTVSGDTGSPVGSTTVAFTDGTTPWALVVTDPLSKVHKYYLDAFGRTNKIIEVTGQGDYSTTFKYDQVNQLTNITDNALNNTGFFFDLTGRRVAVADPDMGFWQYGYDLAGRLVQQTDANGQVSKLFYNDPAGRLTSKEGYNAANQRVSLVTYTYDSSGGDNQYSVLPGQLFSVTDDEGWEKFSYDVRGRTLKTSRYLAKNLQTYTTTYSLDDADRVSTLTFPGASPPTLTYSYDTGGNLSKVQRTDAGGVQYIYYTPAGFDAFGHLTGISFANGVSSAFTFYGTSKRLNNISTTSTNGTKIQDLTHTYDKVGDFSTITDNVATDTGASSSTISATVYDDLYRVTSITWAGSGAKSYSYNSIGNVTMNGEMGVGTYGYGTARPHQVKSANNVSYAYDLNGNMVYRGGQMLSYDVNDRLVQVASVSGATNTFGYSYDGARLWETGASGLQVWIGDHYEERGGKVLYNIMAAGRRICTFEPAAGGSSYNPATQEFYYYHPDHLGSSSVMTDRSGTQVVQHYEYYAFGQDRYVGNSGAFPLSHRYTGQILDADTGLYYYNFRYYDPQLGRFTQPDDIIPDFANPQSYNRYSYCVNNPLRYTDPTGHETYLEGVGNVFMGYYDAGAGAVKGVAFLVAHPVLSAEGVVNAAAHPVNTAGAIANGVAEKWNSGTRGQGEVLGNVLILVATSGAAETEVANVTKVADVSKVGSTAEAGEASAAGAKTAEAIAGPCFVAGTPVATAGGMRTIQSLQVGERVLTTNFNASGSEVDPRTWRRISLSMPNPECPTRDTLDLELLRPETWVRALNCESGATLWLDLEEIGIHGYAHVIRLGACPSIDGGNGRVILATVTHMNSRVMSIRTCGGHEPLEATDRHPLFSATRNRWVPAGQLKADEELVTRTGILRIESVKPKPGIYQVYNIEVEVEHCFYSGDGEILSHNSCAQPVPVQPGPTADPLTGRQVQRFIGQENGPPMIEPVGGSTVSAGKGGVDTHTLYPNKSNYQRLNPKGHKNDPTPHAHGHAQGTGPGKAGQGSSLDTSGNKVPSNSGPAHWPN